MRLGLIVIVMTACFCAVATAQTPDPFPVQRQAAEKGDAAAQLAYAKALDTIYPNPRKAEAMAWAQKAADQGMAEAYYWMGDHSIAPQSLVYWKKSADMAYWPAVQRILQATLGRGPESDIAAAKNYADLARARKIAPADYAAFLAAVDICAAAEPLVINVPEYFSEQIPLVEGYVNGEGKARDMRKAIALVCRGDNMSRVELETIPPFLAKQVDAPSSERFDYCSRTTTSDHRGYCDDRREKQREADRQREIGQLTIAWTPEQKASFAKLQASAEAFFKQAAEGELDHCMLFQWTQWTPFIATYRNSFLASLKSFETGQRPPANDFAGADRELNAFYRKMLSKPDWAHTCAGGIYPEGIRKAQRVWLTYRDAWGEFAMVRYPDADGDNWRAWATRDRIKTLRELDEWTN